jgi:hypothetical protein
MRTTVGRYGGTGLAAAVAALVLTGVGPAAPASADPPGLEIVTSSSAETSADKTITASCPTGKVVSGGGGYLAASTGAKAHVALDRLEPLANGTGFAATMREAGPGSYSDDWTLSAVAACVTQPTGYQVVATTGAAETEYVTASCGTKSVIGMGGRVNSGFGDVVLDQVVPSSDLKSVTVRGVPVQGSTRTGWSVTAFAVCANTPAGLERITTAPSSSNSNSGQSRLLLCPTGKALYSAGVDINAGNGQVRLTAVNLIATDRIGVGANEDSDGYGGNWAVDAYGICA